MGTRVMRRYRLMGGLHQQNHPTIKARHRIPELGREVEVPAQVTYQRGDVFESDMDMVARFGPEKFQRVDDMTPLTNRPPDRRAGEVFVGEESGLNEVTLAPASPNPVNPPPSAPTSGSGVRATLESMPLEALIKHAQDEEIDLKGVNLKSKVEVLARVCKVAGV